MDVQIEIFVVEMRVPQSNVFAFCGSWIECPIASPPSMRLRKEEGGRRKLRGQLRDSGART